MAELNKLEASAPPNLINPPIMYNPGHFSQLNNVLRLYFTRISSALRALFGANGGKYLSFPFIAAYDTTDQYATSTGTPTKILWNTLVAGSGFTLNLDSSATAAQSGTYKIDYSLQVVNTANTQEDMYVWVKINGVNVVGSMSKFSIPARKSAGVPSYIVAYSHVSYNMAADDYIELWWQTTAAYDPVGPVDGVYIEDIPAAGAIPQAPSALGTITFVSALP